MVLNLLSGQLFAQKAQFAENKGQWNSEVQFSSPYENGKLYITHSGFRISVFSPQNDHRHTEDHHSHSEFEEGQQVFSYEFLGTQENAYFQSTKKLPFYYNYLKGKDPAKWASNVSVYEKVIWKEVYPNIDIHFFYNDQAQLKWNYILKPGADINDIQYRINGINTESIEVSDAEILYSSDIIGEIKETYPSVYAMRNGSSYEQKLRLRFEEEIISYQLLSESNYDSLIIDPQLEYSTYSGSNSDNFGFTATFDQNGNSIGGGSVFGPDYPTQDGQFSPLESNYQGGPTDIAISKYDNINGGLLYATFLGGDDTEIPNSLIVNSKNELIILGTTGSLNYPVSTNAYQSGFAGGVGKNYLGTGANFSSNGTDIVLTRLSEDGTSLLASTYFGGTNNDGVNDNLVFNYADQFRGEVVIDQQDNIFIYTSTLSQSDFPILSGFRPLGQNAIFAEFDENLSNLLRSTMIGGNDDDSGYGLVINEQGEAYVTGGTRSTDMNGRNTGVIPNFQGGVADGYIAKLDASGVPSAFTYFGGEGYDQSFFVQIDRAGDPFIYGQNSLNDRDGGIPIRDNGFIIPGANQFIAKLSQDLNSILISTTFGNSNVNDTAELSPTAFLVDKCDLIYVAGWGGSTNASGDVGAKIEQPDLLLENMPLTADAQFPNTDGSDFYLGVFRQDLTSLLYGTYVGDPTSPDHVDGGTSRFDKRGVVHQAVCASCGGRRTGFPTTSNAYSSTNNSPNCNLGVFSYRFDLQVIASSGSSTKFQCENGKITFSNDSKNAQRFLWDFGNGETSEEEGDVTTQYDPGEYTVTLVAYNDTTCNLTDTTRFQIEIPEPTESQFSIDNAKICKGESITFNNSSINAKSYEWDFGNGQTSDDEGPLTIQYPDPGIYTVSLLAVTDSLCENFDEQTAIVEVIDSVQAFAELIGEVNCAPLTIQFKNNAVNGETYKWDFGNGETSTTNSKSVSSNYNDPGTYTVTLIAYNDNSCNKSDTTKLTVQVLPELVPDFDILTVPDCAPIIIDFDANSNIPGSTYSWSFGNGETSNQKNPAIEYKDPGIFTIILTASNPNSCNKEVSIFKEIEIPSKSRARAQLSTVNQCAPGTFIFENQSVGAETYKWDFGNGETSTQNGNVSSFYPSSGKYIIQLIAENSGKCASSDTLDFELEILDPVNPVAQVQNISEGCAPVTVDFSNNSENATEILWDFGNGETSTDFGNISTTYTEPGEYTAKLIVSNPESSCNKLDSVEFTINVPDQVKAEATILTEPTCAPAEINFSSLIQNATNVKWDFGNGRISTQPGIVSTIYNTPGTYQIQFIAFNNQSCNLSDTVNLSIVIPEAPEAVPVLASNPSCAPSEVFFTNNSIGINTAFWDFGNGETSNDLNNVSSVYTEPGSYTISLTVSNDINCPTENTASLDIIISPPPKLDIDYSVIEFCDSAVVQFQNTSTQSFSFEWAYPDGSTSTEDSPEHVIKQIGDNVYTVVAEPLPGCDKQDIQTITVPFNPVIVKADYSISETVFCDSLLVSLVSNQPSGNGTYQINNGPKFPISGNIDLKFEQLGTYQFTIIQENVNSCNTSDTLVKEIDFQATRLFADIQVNTVKDCDSIEYQITNNSLGSTENTTHEYIWSDGLIINESENYSRKFAAGQTIGFDYLISDPNSCNGNDGTTFQETYIARKLEPEFDFEVLPGCTPYQVQFTTSTPDDVDVEWYVGDGSIYRTDTFIFEVQEANFYYAAVLILDGEDYCNPGVRVRKPFRVLDTPITAQFDNSRIFNCDSVINNLESNTFLVDSFRWFLNGNFSSFNEDFSFQQNEFGVDTITFIAGNEENCRKYDTLIQEIEYKPDSVFADFTYSEIRDCQFLRVSMSDESINSSDILIDWGDGLTSSGTEHIYQTFGSYTIQAIALNNESCNKSDTVEFQVEWLNEPVSVDVSQSNSSNCDSQTVQLLATASATDSIRWKFGNGDSSNVINPELILFENGTYPIQVTIIDSSSCEYTSTAFDTVIVDIKKLEVDLDIDTVQYCDSLVLDIRVKSPFVDQIRWTSNSGFNSSKVSTHIVIKDDATIDYFLSLKSTRTCNFQVDSTFQFQHTNIPTPVFNKLELNKDCDNLILDLEMVDYANETWQIPFVQEGGSGSYQIPLPGVGEYKMFVTVDRIEPCKKRIDTIVRFSISRDELLSEVITDIQTDCDQVDITGQIIGAESNISWIRNGEILSQEDIFELNELAGPEFFLVYDITSPFNCNPDIMDSVLIAASNIELEVDADFASQDYCDSIEYSVSNVSPQGGKFILDGTEVPMPASGILADLNTHIIEYIVVDSSACNIADTFSRTFKANPNNKVNSGFLLDVTGLCDQKSFSSTYVGSSNIQNYTWLYDGQLFSNLPNVNGTETEIGFHELSLIVRNDTTCNIADTFTSSFELLPEFEFIDLAVSGSCSEDTLEFELFSNFDASFTWNYQDGNIEENGNTTEHVFANNGNYLVRITMTDSSFCNVPDEFVKTVSVTEGPDAEFDFFLDTLYTGGTFQVENLSQPKVLSSEAEYSWEFQSETFLEYAPEFNSPKEEGKYPICLEYTLNDCISRVCKQLEFSEAIYGIPTAFSPFTSPGINDILYVRNEGIRSFEFKVFNRWGQLIFTSTSPSLGWDGTYKGEQQDMEVYVWVLEGVLENNQAIRETGTVALIK